MYDLASITFSPTQSINQDILNAPANKYRVGVHGKNEWN